jgi:hypothetical protein
MLHARKKAAQFLRGATKSDLESQKSEDVDDVLDFFETTALLIKKCMLDPYMAWHAFSYWFETYYHKSAAYIQAWRASSPKTWEDLELLHQRFIRFEACKPDEALAESLRTEAEMDIP